MTTFLKFTWNLRKKSQQNINTDLANCGHTLYNVFKSIKHFCVKNRTLDKKIYFFKLDNDNDKRFGNHYFFVLL